MDCRITVRPPLLAQDNMDLDAALLQKEGGAFLEFHRWIKPSFTFGYFVDPQKEFFESDLISIGRRATGGGVLFHGHDLSFSFCFPDDAFFGDRDTNEVYKKLNSWLGGILSQTFSDVRHCETGDFSFKDPYCWSRPTKYDLICGEKKILGCAIRRKNGRILYHGSIPIRAVQYKEIAPFMRRGDAVIEKILQNTYDIGLDWEALRERISYHVTKIG
jgi:lipoate-protein ligase A